ncbi:MAG: protoglobin family protein [Planctomycetota bacterium]|nr:protoglobin family protein [Planctomycetota bacterium]
MKSIDEARLESDLGYRYEYLCEFLDFTAADVARIHGAAPYLGPMIPELVEKTYKKLLSYDATARHFLPRQAGFNGPTPTNLAELTLDNPQVQFRREHLLRYLMQLLGRAYDGKMALYLDMVGKMHTPAAGNKEIDVPLIQMNALMGVLSDCLTEVILELPLEATNRNQTVRSFNKLLWIQNDLVNRHVARQS